MFYTPASIYIYAVMNSPDEIITINPPYDTGEFTYTVLFW